MKKSVWILIGVFIVILIGLILISNVLFRWVLPIKPVFIESENMVPTYNKGDILFYISPANLNVNDIIIFKTSFNPIVTRIISINEDGTYKAKADANPVSLNSTNNAFGFDENNIEKEKIIGKVVFGTKFYIFYPIMYGIEVLIALLLTKLIYKKR